MLTLPHDGQPNFTSALNQESCIAMVVSRQASSVSTENFDLCNRIRRYES